MKDLIDIIADTLRDRQPKEREKILLLVEHLYFNDVIRSTWRRSLFSREALLRAHDIVNLRSSIANFNSIEDVKLKSNLLKNAVENISAGGMFEGIASLPELDGEQKDFINRAVIRPHEYYVTAVLLAELIRDEKRRLRNNQWLTYLIPICTALIAAAAIIFTRFQR
jgi:hypothetical protein